ncbi:MAG: prepilin-type N-terminal cleavage/methylation domain-containing protein [Clostridiales Family XIII bacterium]|jgi:prepilin-type N-terminal cleavage/methylation domain-containing protein|nr:prepilin-type N-terminal cleavage/methylation domain-containing protein [Clostridiales Family XIII bacterium]
MKRKILPFTKRRGFTLVETMVAMAIIAIASVAILGAFGGVLKSEIRATDSKNQAAAIEKEIAGGAAPSGGALPTTLVFEGHAVASQADTYTADRESYTVLDGRDPVAPFAAFFGDFGDQAKGFKQLGEAYDTGAVGRSVDWPVRVSGRYLVEAWGAGCESTGHKGGYTACEAALASGETLAINIGGRGEELLGSEDGGLTEVARDADIICSAPGGKTADNVAAIPDPYDENFSPKKAADGSYAPLTMNGNARGGFVRITYLGIEN